MSTDIFYNYVYFDLRKPGKYSYPGLSMSFLFEPILVGKGKQNRYLSARGRPINFINKVNKILRTTNFTRDDMVIKIITNLTEIEALTIEKWFIDILGRKNSSKGPLLNFTNGGDGGTGKVHTPETLVKMRNAKLGKKHTPETIAKMSKAKSKPWIIIDPNGTKIDVFGLKEFARINGLNYNSLKNHGKFLGYLCEKVVR